MSGSIFLKFNNGDASKALIFYEDVFKITPNDVRTFAMMPDFPPELENLIMYSEIKFDNLTIMIADAEENVTIGQNVALSIDAGNVKEAILIFEKLAIEGQVIMPIQKTFFALAYGEVIDKFGVSWMITATQ